MHFKTMLLLTATSLSFGLGGLMTSPTPVHADSQSIIWHPQGLRKEALHDINHVRLQHHLRPLRLQKSLNHVAQLRAFQLTERFTHYNSQGQTIVDTMLPHRRLVAENIGMIQNDNQSNLRNVKTIINSMYFHDGGINHWGHRKNFLNRHANHIGIGFETTVNHTIYMAFDITN